MEGARSSRRRQRAGRLVAVAHAVGDRLPQGQREPVLKVHVGNAEPVLRPEIAGERLVVIRLELYLRIFADFVLEPGLVFLNHGSFGATPRAVLEAQHELVVQMERNPVAWLGRRAEALMADARSDLAAFVGASPDDLVFFPNPTTAMNMVVRSLKLQSGDEIVTTDHEYGAMDRTWRHRCLETGAVYRPVPIPLPVGDAQNFIERVWAEVTERTRVLFLSHITSATALVFPVAELVRRARAGGVLTIVDGAHAVAHFPFALRDLDLMTSQGQTIQVFLGITGLIIPQLVMVIAPICEKFSSSRVLRSG